ncbi:MAG: helix-turn-helix transcriptional regulator [Defluviitaleaceae bacterium]|nr:helix-turn-helix transcriptional regulator [Defluviitaleaceae bacterium]
MYADVFPSRLKKSREYNGLTQDEVSKALKIHRTTYTNYEAGRSEPNLEMLALLSRLLDVSSDWLVGLTSDSGLNSMSQVIQEREREKILKKLEKEAELNRKVWG